MKRICISYETGGERRGGHFTEFSFCGLPGVEITALADANAENEHAFRLSGALRRYTDWREMITAEKPDITVFCSRLPDEHMEQIGFALRHGSHVLCEKPLAPDLEACDQLTALAKARGLLVQVAHLARFAPVFDEMRRLIWSGAIGRPLSCLMRGKEDGRGGGEDMMVLGTHLFDYSVSVFGLPESVYASVRQGGGRITESSRLAASEPVGRCAGDDIFAHFRYANGVNGVFESRRGMVSGFAPATRMGIAVTGTKGSLSVRYDGDRELRYSAGFPVPMEFGCTYSVVPVPPAREIPGAVPFDYTAYGLDAKSAAHRYYADNNRRAAWNLLLASEGREALLSSAEDASASLEMIEGVYRSAVSGREEALPAVERRHPLAGDAPVR